MHTVYTLQLLTFAKQNLHLFKTTKNITHGIKKRIKPFLATIHMVKINNNNNKNGSRNSTFFKLHLQHNARKVFIKLSEAFKLRTTF